MEQKAIYDLVKGYLLLPGHAPIYASRDVFLPHLFLLRFHHWQTRSSNSIAYQRKANLTIPLAALIKGCYAYLPALHESACIAISSRYCFKSVPL